MSYKLTLENNAGKILQELEAKQDEILYKWGATVANDASELAPRKEGVLKGSITHVEDKNSTTIGSNVEYAPYQELGTGGYFEEPPDWIDFTTTKTSEDGRKGVKANPFLQPAVELNKETLKKQAEKILKG